MAKKKIVILFILGVILLGIIFIPGYLKIRRLDGTNSQLEAQVVQLKQDNKRLVQEQKRLQEDPLYLEEVARKKLGVAKKGEIIYKVVPLEEK